MRSRQINILKTKIEKCGNEVKHISISATEVVLLEN
jgi:hypothetical protein